VDLSGNETVTTVDFTTAAQDEATVTADATAVQGETFVLSVTSDPVTDIESITTTGACIDDQDNDAFSPPTTADTLAFAVLVNPDAPLGSCVLTTSPPSLWRAASLTRLTRLPS
jgi:hypothetical protein